jgi:hypothetical protein
MSAGPAQCPGVDLWPAIAAHAEVEMQDPLTPDTLQVGGGGAGSSVQHSMLAGPGQKPGVDTCPGIAAQAAVVMQVPVRSLALQLTGVVPPGPHWP